MDHAQALQAVQAANTLLDKIKGETQATLQKVTDLELVIQSLQAAGQTLPQELTDAITALTTKVAEVDALVPDTTTG